MQPRIVAEDPHAQLALADTFEAAAKRRSHQDVKRQQRGCEKAEDQKEERPLVGQVEPETRPGGDIDAVVAAGERVPAISEPPDALAERQRDHQEIDAAGADREQPEERRGRRADQHAQQHHQPKIPAQAEIVFGGEDRGQISADAEIRRLAERGEADKAEQKIDAHRQDREDERAGGQQHHEGAGERNDDGERQKNRGNGEDFGCLAHPHAPHSRPNRPVGLIARISTIGA